RSSADQRLRRIRLFKVPVLSSLRLCFCRGRHLPPPMVDTSATNAAQQVGHLTFGLWRIRPALYSEPLSHFGHLMTTFAESGVDSLTEVSSVSDESSSMFD